MVRKRPGRGDSVPAHPVQFEVLEPRNMLAVGLGSGLQYSDVLESSLIYNLQPGYSAADQVDVLRQHTGAGELDSFRLVSSTVDQLGISHHKYQQVFAGIDVALGTYTVHSVAGQITSLSGHFVEMDPATDIYAGLGNDLAAKRAMEYMDQRCAHSHSDNPDGDSGHGPGCVCSDCLGQQTSKRYVWEDPALAELVGLDGPLTGQLTYYTSPRKQTELVYMFDLYVIEPVVERTYVYVNANTGAIEGDMDLVHGVDIPADGPSLYDGDVNFTADVTFSLPIEYRLRQVADGVETYDMQSGTSYAGAVDFVSATSTFNWPGQGVGVQTHWASEQTMQYFLNVHGRNSFDDAGTVLRSYVSYGSNYVNAFWNGSFATYGDGNGSSYGPLVSLDVVGHEVAHGVTQYAAGLIYSYESGALNESFSDIFGEMVERYARGSNDWMMGADFDLVDGDGFRSMSFPKAKGDPDTYQGDNWWTSPGDYGGVHTNSGVQNKWFYILSQGEAGTNDHGFSYDVTGIGMDDADAIAYRNLVTYLTPGSSFQDAREGAIQAAIDLFGAGSQQHQSTDEAWEAVGLYDQNTVTEFRQLAPEGSLIYESVHSGEITAANPADTYILDLDAQQSLTVVVQGEAGVFDPYITVIDQFAVPIAVSGPSWGNNTVANNVPVDIAQKLAVRIDGSGTTGSYEVRFLLNTDFEDEALGGADNSSRADAVSLDSSAIDLGDPASIHADHLATLGAMDPDLVATPLDDFESGPPLGSDWTTWSSHPSGQITVTDQYGAAGGNYALVMEQAAFGAYNLNEAILTVDMTTATSTWFSFDHTSFSDENHVMPAQFAGSFNGDGVAVSDDGINWFTIMTGQTPAAGVWENYMIDLQLVADAHPDLDLVADFRIKFQQYDDLPVSFGDGRGFDNLALGNTLLGSDWYSFTTESDQQVTIVGTHLEDQPDVQVDLFDAAETLLASGTPGVPGTTIVESEILQYPLPGAGTWYVRVSGAGDYSLLITRDATFDTETPGPRDITHLNGVLGHVRAFKTLDAEPDLADDGALLDTAFPGVTLTTNGMEHVYAAKASFQAPTGSQVFRPEGGTAAGWGESNGTVLRADFAEDQAFVSIDVGSDDYWDQAFLRAFDAAGNLLDEVVSGNVPIGGSETISIQRASNEISYVEASGVGSNRTPLDRLVFNQNDVDQDVYTLNVQAGDVINLEAFLPGGGSGQFTNPLGEANKPRIEMVLEDPATNIVAGGSSTLQHTALLDGTYRLTVLAVGARGEYYVGHRVYDQTEWNFDFGKRYGPVEPGFVEVRGRADLYDPFRGFGWTDYGATTKLIQMPEGPSDLTIDHAMADYAEFAANVPSGDYRVDLHFGWQYAGPQYPTFVIEGQAYAITPTPYTTFTTVVTVDDGQLNLALDGMGGKALLSGLSISSPAELRFDFGRKNGPVEPGFTEVNGIADVYDPLYGFGWTNLGSTTKFIQTPGGPSDLRVDHVMADLAEFAIDVPNGEWQVTLHLGWQYAIPESPVFTLEGVPFTLSPPVAYSDFVTTVTVADGQFNLILDGNGFKALLSGLTLTQSVAPPVTGFAGPGSDGGGRSGFVGGFGPQDIIGNPGQRLQDDQSGSEYVKNPKVEPLPDTHQLHGFKDRALEDSPYDFAEWSERWQNRMVGESDDKALDHLFAGSLEGWLEV